MKTKKSKHTDTLKQTRKTWLGLKPRKEATKKERIEKLRNKHRSNVYEN